MRYCAHVEMKFSKKREEMKERDALIFGHKLDEENTCNMPKNTHQ